MAIQNKNKLNSEFDRTKVILLYFFYCVYDFFARVKNFRRGLDKHLKFVNEIKRQIKYINDNE